MIAIAGQEETEVYCTEDGYICVAQESLEFGTMVQVFIRPENLSDLIRALKSAKAELNQAD
jgi:hypothetical protein